MVQPAGSAAAGPNPVASSFGPSAVATPANAISVLRLLLAIPLFLMIVDDPSSWTALALWIVLSATDGVDGWLARKQGTTRSGAFLDPLADKVLVLGAMWALVAAEVFSVAAGRDHHRPGGGDQPVPQLLGQAGSGRPRDQGRQAQDRRADDRRRSRPRTRRWPIRPGWPIAMLWLAVAITVVTGVQYFIAGSRGTRVSGRL